MRIYIAALLTLSCSNAFAQHTSMPAGYTVCQAASGLNTLYYSAPFRAAPDNRYAWIPAFAEYLDQNYGYRGFVTCKTKLPSVGEAQAYLSKLIARARDTRLSDGSPQNYVETGWTYSRTTTLDSLPLSHRRNN